MHIPASTGYYVTLAFDLLTSGSMHSERLLCSVSCVYQAWCCSSHFLRDL